jgi:hypothetical protein
MAQLVIAKFYQTFIKLLLNLVITAYRRLADASIKQDIRYKTTNI